jgi:MSHA biogenesis protein MshE
MARPEKIRLGDLLIQQGLLTDEQLKFALDEQKRSGRKLGRIVVESSFVTEEAISKALARQLQASYVDLKHFNPRQNLINLLPEAQARRFRAVVLDEINGRLQVGFVDPTDLQAYDDVVRLLRRDIELAVVAESQLLALIDRVYRRTEEITGLAKELTADLGDVPIEFGDLLGAATGAEEAPVVKLLQTVFEEAMRARASDIHIEPQDRSLRVRFRIDGVLHVQMEADAKIAPALALRLKLMSGLDISEKRLPQDGRFAIKVRNAMVDVRISTMPTQYGESVVMRLLNQNTGLLGLDRLNMPPRTLERLRHAVRRPSGMVLVTGPTGSGKTTTLYAALSELNTTEKKIITVEDPVEYRLPGINQVQVHEKIDPQLRARAAFGLAPGPGHRPRWRNARPDDRGNRHARGNYRAHGAVHAAHQRRHLDADPPARHGRAALHGRAFAATGAGAAAGACHLRKLRRTALARAARTRMAALRTRRYGRSASVHAGERLRALRRNRLQRPNRRL